MDYVSLAPIFYILFTMGVWVGGINIVLLNKANKSDVAKHPVEREQISQSLKNIFNKLDELQKITTVMDERQRTISDDVIALKVRAEG